MHPQLQLAQVMAHESSRTQGGLWVWTGTFPCESLAQRGITAAPLPDTHVTLLMLVEDLVT